MTEVLRGRLALVAVLSVIVILTCSSICAQALEPASFPSLISSVKIPPHLEFCGEPVPLQNQKIRERFEKEMLIALWDRPQVILWLKRSRRYLPIIEGMLTEAGVPDDLKYVAIAESALRPHARSGKAAVGFWQFIRPTGRRYGLHIDRSIDERRNIFASTQAAIRYLSDLYEIFGAWTLAAAAYNMGEERLEAEMREQEVKTYYHLYLPLETQRYVFRILSAKLIVSDPIAYGFNLSDHDYYPPLKFDRIQFDCTQDTPIRIVAQAAKTHFKAIKDLNPEIRGHYLPKGNHEILIPEGSSKGFQVRYRQLLEYWSTDGEKEVYVIKRGDSLSAIADRLNIPLSALLIWNRLDPDNPIHPGDTLVIRGGRR
jgi:hypothetical protein